MKRRNLIAAIAAALIIGGAAAVEAQVRMPMGGPGIVMSGSQNYSSLPKSARSFIEKHFKGISVIKCEQYFAKNKYEVELSNGVDIDFDKTGKVIEIDAPDNTVLPKAVVKEVLSAKAYMRLEKEGLAGNVESIEFDRRKKNIEVELSIPDPDTYLFDIDGTFIALTD